MEKHEFVLPVPGRDHIRGPARSPVRLLEYGDFQCPHCRAATGSLHQLESALGGRTTIAFRHFPLTSMHPLAESAAMAAEAAGAQGRFWEMHDTIFANQDLLTDEDVLTEFAQELDLDLDAFQDAMATGRFAPRVREDFLGGVRAGVNGTPTFFINGVRHDGGYDFPTLFAAMKAAGARSPRATGS